MKLKYKLTLGAVAVLAATALAAQTYAPNFFHVEGTGRAVVPTGGSLDIESGGELDIESGGAIKIAGTAIASTAAELNILDGVTSTAAELNILDGASATVAELDEYAITVKLPDISAAQSVWVVAPHAGTISKIYTVIDTAITVGDATITAEIGGTLVTDSSITIANAGSAAGDVDSSSPSAANTLTAGQALEIITDGGSTDTSIATVTVLVAR